MQFAFTDEQEQFRESVRRFLARHSPPADVRRLMATEAGFDPAVWRQLADDLALAAVPIPEAYGGVGFGPVELGIALEEQGRALLCAPYFSSCVLGAEAILAAASDAQKADLLPGIAAGTTRATLALAETAGRWDAASVRCVATRADGRWLLDGEKKFVVDGATADLIVVVARVAGGRDVDGVSFFAVAGNAAGLRRARLETMDATRKLARMEFAQTPAILLGEAGSGAALLPRVLDHALIGLANEMVGGAQALLDSAVAYAKLRVQFGRPIGSFQAIKHRLADMLLDVELAKSLAYGAAQAEAEHDPETPMLAAMAKAAAADAYVRTAAATIQIHGGIGFTWENDTHLYFKRAKSSEVLLGDPNGHRERALQTMES
jgi:alkylation response protein AidB-like acyl-CoA dehydrogenase